MGMEKNIKPISYLKANAAKIADELKQSHSPMIITQNGEAAMVVLSVAEYERTQQALAMSQILGRSKKDIENGNTVSSKAAFAALRKRRGV